MPGYRKDVIRILEAHGCAFVRHGKGSHDVWRSPLNGRQFILQHDLYRVAANRVLKEAGIDERV